MCICTLWSRQQTLKSRSLNTSANCKVRLNPQLSVELFGPPQFALGESQGAFHWLSHLLSLQQIKKYFPVLENSSLVPGRFHTHFQLCTETQLWKGPSWKSSAEAESVTQKNPECTDC